VQAATIDENLRLQYQQSSSAAKFRADMDSLNASIKANKKAVCFDYTPTGQVKTQQTGQLANGKRFGTGSVGGLDNFAKELLAMLYTAIDAGELIAMAVAAKFSVLSVVLREKLFVVVLHQLHLLCWK